jgi:hypothetical protein
MESRIASRLLDQLRAVEIESPIIDEPYKSFQIDVRAQVKALSRPRHRTGRNQSFQVLELGPHILRLAPQTAVPRNLIGNTTSAIA